MKKLICALALMMCAGCAMEADEIDERIAFCKSRNAEADVRVNSHNGGTSVVEIRCRRDGYTFDSEIEEPQKEPLF